MTGDCCCGGDCQDHHHGPRKVLTKEEKLAIAALKRVAKKSEEMSFKELFEYIRNIESEGYDATPYRVDFHAKFALPVACLIVSVVRTILAASY